MRARYRNPRSEGWLRVRPMVRGIGRNLASAGFCRTATLFCAFAKRARSIFGRLLTVGVAGNCGAVRVATGFLCAKMHIRPGAVPRLSISESNRQVLVVSAGNDRRVDRYLHRTCMSAQGPPFSAAPYGQSPRLLRWISGRTQTVWTSWWLVLLFSFMEVINIHGLPEWPTSTISRP